MKTKRPFTPAFINQLDEYLLLNKPVTWTARTHLVVYFSLLFMAVLTVLTFIVPDDPRSDSSVFMWVTLTAVLAAIGFIIWCIFLLRFNVFKRFGEDKPFDALKTFLLYFISILFIILPCYIPLIVESVRTNSAFGNEEIVNDINAINTKICLLERDSLHLNWYEAKYIVRDTLTDVYYDKNEETIERSSQDNEYKIIDTTTFHNKKAAADSVVKINDSMWHLFSCPNYIFLQNYKADVYTKSKTLSSVELYNLVLRNYKMPDKEKISKELKDLIHKYRTGNYSSLYNDESNLLNDNYFEKVKEKYSLHNVDNSIGNLVQRKYRWYSDNESRIRFFFYLTFILTLLIFIFRHSTVKTFFLTILSGIILTIISGLFMAFLRAEGEGMYLMIILYYAIFFAIALTVFNRKTRLAIDGIAINMITFFTTFIPLFCVLLYYEIDEKKYHMGLRRPVDYDDQRQFYLLIAEIAGIVLFLILIEPLFKRLFRNWYAKPEQ